MKWKLWLALITFKNSDKNSKRIEGNSKKEIKTRQTRMITTWCLENRTTTDRKTMSKLASNSHKLLIKISYFLESKNEKWLLAAFIMIIAVLCFLYRTFCSNELKVRRIRYINHFMSMISKFYLWPIFIDWFISNSSWRSTWGIKWLELQKVLF